ncbi:MAG: protein-export chaperone SecB [Steroidobacteraceae bacterium]|nr:protein-export chaperone SecB [Steroidobacteraceae bacterium]MDW8259911.1 protein-export chaperone SecB [Gammaproteobacteria bacterium]
MATEAPPDEPPNAEFTLQLVYLKDCSFEAPKGPRFDARNWAPNIALDLDTAVESLGEHAREIVLTVSVTAKVGEETIFIAEVKQAGAFVIRGLSDSDFRRAVASVGPSLLFPYARATISQLVSQGGFPQLLLPPVNFEALYARSLAEAQTATKN